MTNTSSDLKLGKGGSSSVRAAFYCDGKSVAVQFFTGEKRVGRRIVLTRAKAAEVGKRVAESGIYEDFPVSGVNLEEVKTFGIRLRQYGENGR